MKIPTVRAIVAEAMNRVNISPMGILKYINTKGNIVNKNIKTAIPIVNLFSLF